MTTRIVQALATGLGVGYIPLIPGTAGSVVGIGVAFLLTPLSSGHYLLVVGISSLLAIWIADQAMPLFSAEDPKQIVIDEIVGYLVAVAWHPWSWRLAIAAFLCFRLFDITKPFPCRRLEHLPGGGGIVADDLMAGLYANLLLWCIGWWIAL